MADAYGLVWPGDTKFLTTCTPEAVTEVDIERYNLKRVPLMIETAKARRADDLHTALKGLVDSAKRLTAFNDARPASLLIADELLKKIELEEANDG